MGPAVPSFKPHCGRIETETYKADFSHVKNALGSVIGECICSRSECIGRIKRGDMIIILEPCVFDSKADEQDSEMLLVVHSW